jgi:hypothetical protein
MRFYNNLHRAQNQVLERQIILVKRSRYDSQNRLRSSLSDDGEH